MPLVQRRVVHVPPALTLSAQIILDGSRRVSRPLVRNAARRSRARHDPDDLCRRRARRSRERAARAVQVDVLARITLGVFDLFGGTIQLD